MQITPTFEEIDNLHKQLVEMRIDYWINNSLFSFQWWLLLFVFIVPWFIWWKFVDNKRIYDILLFGSLLMILVLILDDLGVEFQLWSYPHQLFIVLPRLISVDQGIIIVAHMFLYQFFRSWKSFILANTIMAFVFSFICEPVTVWLGIYRLENWKYIYSFPIYILKSIFIKWIVDRVIRNKKNKFISKSN
ncbi:hypothetical protein DS745_23195 [Anaerobacillus alkaliphilus]|uniref:Uncharacterized protein n=1 Tax=Anaerobacillus alkaliphilus TaxID=1548597 RepID=A0A4V1LFV5_9BACI|nr:CBO0543 family protein [Anaerobacillus alkaliphilus]RXI96609.1 hypothetical protein DS745_23195 [Anaerobacillus alkaliphilus]